MWDRIDRWERILARRPSSRRNSWGSRRSGSGPNAPRGFSGPNAPKMITVVLSVALALAGLVLTDTISIGFVSDLLANTGIDFTREHGYWMLLGSPGILILGSLLPGL